MSAVLLLIATARAAPDAAAARLETSPSSEEPAASPARRCAQAAEGSEVEICLRLSVENPDAVEEIASALIAHIDHTEAPDRALLDGLLELASERPTDGASTLGTLDDPRVVPVLLKVAHDSDPELSSAAISAVVRWPSAIPVLGTWLTRREEPLARRMAIARALGAAQRAEAADALQDALRRRMPATLRAAITHALEQADPERLAYEQETPSADGAAWLAAGTSVGLAYALGAAAELGNTEVIRERDDQNLPSVPLWTVGAATGGVGGASGGWLYARAFPIEAGDAAFIATTGNGAGLAGFLIGAGLRSDPANFDPALVGGILGEAIGFPLAIRLSSAYDGTARDALEAVLLTGMFTAATESTAQFLQDSGIESPRATVTGVAVAAGLVLGHTLAPHVSPTEGLGLVGLGAAAGVGVGLLVPLGDHPRSTLPVATGLVGAGIGGMLAHSVHLSTDAGLGAFGGATIGAGVGGGVGLLASPGEPDLARGLALGGSALGFGLGATMAALDPDPIDDRDVAIALAASGWAAWDAVAVGILAQSGGHTGGGTGALLLASSVAGGGAIALNSILDVPVPYTLSASSAGLWGGYAGAAVADLLGIEPLALALPGSNLGLLGGSLLVSPLVGAPPLVIGVADTFGVLGASVAGIGAAIAGGPQRSHSVVGWSLSGAVVGLAAGATIGTVWVRSGDRRDIALSLPGWARPRLPSARTGVAAPAVRVSPFPIREGYGFAVEVVGW